MAPEKSDRDILTEISGKLDKILGVLAIQGKDLDMQIKILTRLGLSSAEIGALVGQRAESYADAAQRSKDSPRAKSKGTMRDS